MEKSQGRIEFLDWLRALAVAMVVFGHSVNSMAPGGGIGVSIFFVLSGFLIADILLRDGIMTPANVATFIVRRIGRIYPMYVAHIAAIFIYCLILSPEQLEAASSSLRKLLMFQSPTGQWFGYAVGVLWTLRIEFWFYVTFPLVLWLATLTRRPLGAMVALGLASIAYKLAGGVHDVLQYYDQFLLGAAAAYLVRSGSIRIWMGSKILRVSLVGLLFVLMAIPVTSRGLLWQTQSLLTALSTAALILSLYSRRPKIQLPALSFIGAISYSIYLVHAIVLDCWVKIFGPHISNIPAYLATVLIISWATYTIIEQPFQRVVHRHFRFSTKRTLSV